MEVAFAVIGFFVFCGAGIAWDYYKPSRFRTGYHNVSAKKDTVLGGRSGLNGSEGLSGYDGLGGSGSDGGCGGGD